MIPETLMAHVRAMPFRPFRVVMNNGKMYEIRHPEFINVGGDSFIFFHRDQPEGPYRRFEIVSLMLINNLEFIDIPQPVGGNGAPST